MSKVIPQKRKSRTTQTYPIASARRHGPSTVKRSTFQAPGSRIHQHSSFRTSDNQSGSSTRRFAVLTPLSPVKHPRLCHDTDNISTNTDGLNVTSHLIDNNQYGDEELLLDPSYINDIEERTLETKSKRVRKKQASDNPLAQWKPLIQDFLEEFVRLEGRGEHANYAICPDCPVDDRRNPAYRCEDCTSAALLCKRCMLAKHQHLPVHRILEWKDKYFHPCSLKQLGLIFQLGHPEGDTCLRPHPADKNFCVIDTHAIQHVRVMYCGCSRSTRHTTQLLRNRWYPATTRSPATVCTFRVMEHFHLLTLQSKCSAYEYYAALARLTDNTGLNTPPDRYQSFMTMIREWRHLKMLKRAGRALLVDGATQIQEGALAVECPACPHPGRNMPSSIEEVPQEDRWLHRLFLSLDANFRLRRRNVSSDIKDPSLGNGLSYFVENGKYKSHIATCGEQKEPCTCANLAALSKANNHRGEGNAVSGVGSCVCPRHGLIRGQGVGDLQLGERYANMDYIFLSALQSGESNQPSHLLLSYDISCQWYKNLKTRVNTIPQHIRLNISSICTRFLVPKFHLPAHVPACHSLFSFNYTPGAGHTDGESIERDWAMINPVSYSTHEMSPGHRQDTLNDHWGDCNWHKTGFSHAFAKKIRTCVPERIAHYEHFQEMCQNIPPDLIQKWTDMVKAWEAETETRLPRDVEAVNPYELKVNAITQAQIRLELAELEDRRARAGEVFMHEVSPTEFMVVGLELQEHQFRMKEDIGDADTATTTQKLSLQQRRNILNRKLNAWEAIQTIYMPGVACLHHNHQQRRKTEPAESEVEQAEDRLMFFPSEVLRTSPGNVVESSNLTFIEARLREGQAHNSLQELRHYLRLLAHLHRDRNVNSRGQRECTRSITLIKRAEAKKNGAAETYRRAWSALSTLDPDGAWSDSLRRLLYCDIRGLTEADPMLPSHEQTQGRYKTSWIWSATGICTRRESGDTELNECLRVEWCRARARLMRWREEILLVQAEMRRVQVWLTWKAEWWTKQGLERGDLSIEGWEGIHTHCLRQSDLLMRLKQSFTELWEKTWIWAQAEVAKVEGSKKTN